MIPVLITVGAGLIFTGCQATPGAPPALSLEEAKTVTSTFESQGFVAPPRTIHDITAILDQQKLQDPEDLSRRIADVNTPVPDTTDATKLTNFYYNRAKAAWALGFDTRALADFQAARAHMNSSLVKTSRRGKIVSNLAMTQASVGDMAAAIKLADDAVKINPRDLSSHFTRINLYAVFGDMERLRRAWEEGKNQAAQSKWKGVWKSIVPARMDYVYYRALGKKRKAEDIVRGIIETYKRSGEADRTTYIGFLTNQQSNLVGVLKDRGRLVEAEVVARESLLEALTKLGRNNKYTANSVRRFATVLIDQGRFDEAAELLWTAVDIYETSGFPSGASWLMKTRKNLLNVLTLQGDWQGALEQHDIVYKEMVEGRGTPEQLVQSKIAWNEGLALYKGGRAEEALRLAKFVHQTKIEQFGADSRSAAWWGALRAVILTGQGRQKEALDLFRTNTAILRARAGNIQNREEVANKAFRVNVILETYIGLLADIRGTALEREAGIDAASLAFKNANDARSHKVQNALTASGARASADNPELADIVRRDQDTQKQLNSANALLADLLGLSTDQQDTKVIADTRARIDQLRGAQATLGEEIETRFPEYAELVNPKPTNVKQARQALRPGEALITTYVGRERSYVWALPHKGEMAFATVEMEREDIADIVSLLRAALEPNAQTLGDIPDFDVELAYELYAHLLEPVRAGWEKAGSLLVVAHDVLGHLPLSVLTTEAVTLESPKKGEALFANHKRVPWLARRHAVTMVPSVASLRSLRALPEGDVDRKPFAGFGDPYFSTEQATAAIEPQKTETQDVELASRGVNRRGLPVHLRAAPNTMGLDNAALDALPRLPDTSAEIRSIALAMNADLTRDVFLGEQASEGAVKSLDLSGYKVIAFATHGLMPGELNGLTQPALALSAPDVTGGQGDGLLTLDEIMALRLDADWVVLSACNTGSGDGAGAEAVSGLGRAFFYAGTRALLVSNWPVETTSARALTTDLFRRQKDEPDLSRAQALHRAMLSLIDGPGYVDKNLNVTVFSYAHPLFWAPFTLVGDGG